MVAPVDHLEVKIEKTISYKKQFIITSFQGVLDVFSRSGKRLY